MEAVVQCILDYASSWIDSEKDDEQSTVNSISLEAARHNHTTLLDHYEKIGDPSHASELTKLANHLLKPPSIDVLCKWPIAPLALFGPTSLSAISIVDVPPLHPPSSSPIPSLPTDIERHFALSEAFTLSYSIAFTSSIRQSASNPSIEHESFPKLSSRQILCLISIGLFFSSPAPFLPSSLRDSASKFLLDLANYVHQHQKASPPDVRGLLSRHFSKLISEIFAPKILRADWKDHCFWAKWALLSCILHLKHPDFSIASSEDRLIPMVLKISDDFEVHNKAIGSYALLHIVKESNPTEIRWFSDILFDIVHRNLAFREIELLPFSLPCALEVIQALDSNPYNSTRAKVAEELLSGIVIASERPQLIHYLDALTLFVRIQGIAAVPLLQRLISAAAHAFTIMDLDLGIHGVDLLTALFEECWPRMASKEKDIKKIVHTIHTVANDIFIPDSVEEGQREVIDQKKQKLKTSADTILNTLEALIEHEKTAVEPSKQ